MLHHVNDAAPQPLAQPKKRIQAKGWFVTLPQCTLSKEYYLAAIHARYSLDEWLVAEEVHEDGSPHLHAFFKTVKKITWSPEMFTVDGFRGCWLVAKCAKAVAKYCAKDGKWIGNIDPKAFTQKTSKFKDLEKVVKGELTLSGWVEQDYARIVDLQRVQLGLKLFKAIKARDNLQVCTDQIPNSWCIPMPITGDKRRHYWVWSSGPNFGKTTWLKWLSDRFRCSWYNTSEGFQSDIREDTQFLLFDEYSGGKVLKSTQLNQMCDGTYIYPFKGGAGITLQEPILIVTGNRNPQELYPNAWPFIQARFNVFQLGEDDQLAGDDPIEFK